MLAGPVARVGVAFCLIALAFAGLAALLRSDHWVLFLAVFLTLALVAGVMAARSVVRLRDDVLDVPGSGRYRWQDIEAVHIAPSGDRGMFCPVVDVAEGRAIRPIPLEGLTAHGVTQRLQSQANEIARRASVDVTWEQPEDAPAPRRAAGS